MAENSRILGFHKKPVNERQDFIRGSAALNESDVEQLTRGGIDLATAEGMIENVVGLYSLPLGIATNFLINQREILVPMVIEEPSVVAGASLAARLAREGGGFTAEADAPEMIGQIQILDVPNVEAAERALRETAPGSWPRRGRRTRCFGKREADREISRFAASNPLPPDRSLFCI